MTKHTTRPPQKKARTSAAPAQTASEAIGTLEPGCRVVGFTKGQFSLLDLIRSVLEQTGSADVVVSTWTTGIRDSENAEALVQRGIIRSLCILTDRSFAARQPEYCRQVIKAFGPEAIRCTMTHAKFALISNETWNITIRSSMNLNRNPRFEQFDLDDCPEIFAFFKSHVDEMWELMPPGGNPTSPQVYTGFKDALGGGIAESVYGPDDELKNFLRSLAD